MPKYGIHHVVIQEAISKLSSSADSSARAAADDLASNPSFANLGAIGPDLFFWAPDFGSVDKLYKLYSNIDKIVEIYNSVVQPVKDMIAAVGEPVQDAVETLSPSTVELLKIALNEVRETSKLFQVTLQTGLFAGVLEGANLITDAADIPSLTSTLFQDVFEPPLQKGKDERHWYWFDMLHYRRTGEFGRTLVKNAHTPIQRAYAFGYLSHIATDLVGHAYVNQVVGGPYRLQVQRHVTVENFMDTWKFREHFGEEINQTLFKRLSLAPSLDGSVRNMLFQTFKDVYQGGVHPTLEDDFGGVGDDGGFLSHEQIDITYDVFYKVLEFISRQSVSRPEEPFSGVADVLQQALKDLLTAPPHPPNIPGGKCSVGDILAFGLTESSQDCYEQFFSSLPDWLEYIGELMSWLLETLLDLLDLLSALLLALPVTVLLSILYGIQLLVYEVYQSLRRVLALEGFVFPDSGDLDTSHGRNLTTPLLCGIHGCRSVTAGSVEAPSHAYPRVTNLSTSHLVCPAPTAELQRTVPSFDAASNVTPNTFISESIFSKDVLKRYADSNSPGETRRLWGKCLSIGNAIDLTSYMVSTAADTQASSSEQQIAHADWNLDSDRGYAYKTWSGNLPATGTSTVSEEYEEQ